VLGYKTVYAPVPGRWLGNDTDKTKFCRLIWILGACQAKTNPTELLCKAALGCRVLTEGTESETSSPLSAANGRENIFWFPTAGDSEQLPCFSSSKPPPHRG